MGATTHTQHTTHRYASATCCCTVSVSTPVVSGSTARTVGVCNTLIIPMIEGILLHPLRVHVLCHVLCCIQHSGCCNTTRTHSVCACVMHPLRVAVVLAATVGTANTLHLL